MSSPIPELVSISEAIERAKDASPSGWQALRNLPAWEIYTDGSAPIKNPGGAIGFSTVFLLDPESAFEVFGGTPGRTTEPATSNNRAEISGALAIFEVLYSLKLEEATLPKTIDVVCDSKYVVNCAQGRWKKHKNKDLWRRFDQLMCVARQNKVKVNFRWTRAHVGTEWNERADVLAKDGAYLAIGQAPDSEPEPDAPSTEAPCEKPKSSNGQYVLTLYSEMCGQSKAMATYRLATPSAERSCTEQFDKVTTLDEAEYRILHRGLDDLLQTLRKAGRDPAEFRVLVDSSRDLMLKQLQGLYGVKSARLQPLHKNASALTRQFAAIEWLKSNKQELRDALKDW